MSFEARLARLEEIASQLEGEDLELGSALKLFEEGVEVLRLAAEELRGTEGTVKQLIERLDGAFELPDFKG